MDTPCGTTMMRIAVNGKSLGIQEKGGAVRVALRILTELARQYPDLTLEVFLPISHTSVLTTLQLPDNVILHSQYSKFFQNSIMRTIWEQIALPFWLRCHPPFDILLHLTNTAPVLQFRSTPEVLLLHDVGFLNTEWFSKLFSSYVKWSLQRAIQRDVQLVTVSQSSAREIQAAFPTVQTPIQAIWNGVDPPPAQMESRSFSQDYILLVGSLNPRKNLLGAIAGYSRFQERNQSNLQLVIVGATKAIFAQTGDFLKTNAQSITMLGYVDESLKWSLLKNAKLLLLPSFMEGFGLPVAEALLVGTPAVVSDIPVFHELFGQSVEYVDPHSPQDIARGIETVIDRSVAQAETEQHYRPDINFLWQNAAQQYFNLFQAVRRR
jgi:glycosyltransferase involved in cell wall biosynthesis